MTHKRRKNRGGRPRRTGEHGKLANNAITIRLTDDERAEWDEGAADDFETTGAWVRSLVERELDVEVTLIGTGAERAAVLSR